LTEKLKVLAEATDRELEASKKVLIAKQKLENNENER